MNLSLFKVKINSLKEEGFQILFDETHVQKQNLKTYMADEQGNTAIIQAIVKENGDVDYQQVIIPVRALKRFCDESIKVYDDALTKRLHINK
jgi:hypothetical protein